MPLSKKNPRIAVVGGGLGGLACALRLAVAGARVSLFEKNSTPGGKLAEHREGPFRWDMGPSLLTLPHLVDELFAHAGIERASRLELTRVDPTCRYFWSDGTVIDEDGDFFARPDVTRFMQYARGIYEISGEAFLEHPPEEFWRPFLRPSALPKLRHLPKICTFATMQQKVDRYFGDPHLRQLFGRYATYNGSSPWRTPASFNVIPFVEAEFGAWYVRGGMARLAQEVARLASEKGVEIQTSSPVERLDSQGLHFPDGCVQRGFDAIILNTDVIRSYRDWIRLPDWEGQARMLQRHPLSTSGLVMLLGTRRRYSTLSHHNILFSDDYPGEFRELFDEPRRLPTDPTLYISATSRSDPADASHGGENLFVLLNAPADTDAIDWDSRREEISRWLLEEMERRGLDGLSSDVQCQHLFTPADFARRDGSIHGALYGWASHGILDSLFRPPLRSPLADNVYFVGGTTHPGGGIPLVLLSARMVADKVIRQLDSIKPVST